MTHGAARRPGGTLRFGLVDGALLVGLGLLWCACFGLHLQQLAIGSLAWVPIQVQGATSEHSYPTVSGFWNDALTDAPGLAIGDRVLGVGDETLRGKGRLAFVASVYRAADRDLRSRIRFERAGASADAFVRLVPVQQPWRLSVLAVALAAVGTAVLWRGRGSSFARTVFVTLMGFALYWCYFFGGPPVQTYLAAAVFGAAPAIAFPMALRALLIFPAEVARSDRWSSVWPWAFATIGVAITTWAFGVPLAPGLGRPLALGLNLAFLAVLMGLLALDYRRSGRLGRRQLRWILLGAYVTAMPPLFASGLALLVPSLWWVYEIAQLSWLALPVCIFIAIDRFNAGDIDRLISAAASYTLVSALLLATLLVTLPAGAAVVGRGLKLAPAMAEVVVAISLALLLVPVHRALKPHIERMLFPERHALETGARELRQALGRCEKLEELLDALGYELGQLLHPDCAAIYALEGSTYVPVFEQGPGVVPAFAADGSLADWMLEERGPVHVARLGRRARPHLGLTSVERAALEAMGAHVLLPVLRDGSIAAFLCLGQKRSGDVYTRADLEILRTIGEKASDRLRDLDEGHRRRQEHEQHERLRPYVPGPVADLLAQGEPVEQEMEVTVFFVDIRGYSSFAERQRVRTVFAFINRYTETVTGIVNEAGGTVVEFNGDGMMAVFGAPQPLANKEQAAVFAARAIVSKMPLLASLNGETLDVGVGIATGIGLVGTIRGANRHIWTALGPTTNLASRLQSLSRELDASIVIDSPTRRACRAEQVPDFHPHERFAIRGLLAPQDIHALPRRPTAARV